MRVMELLKKSVTPLNLILLAAALILLGADLTALLDTSAEIVPTAGKNLYMEGSSSKGCNPPVPNEFSVILEKNIFHPERKLTGSSSQTSPSLNTDIILYGTLVTPKTKIAYVEDRKNPAFSASGAKRQLALKRGETIGGFVLQEVYPDKIVLVREGQKMIVTINTEKQADEQKPQSASRLPQPQPGQAQTEGSPKNPPTGGQPANEPDAHPPVPR